MADWRYTRWGMTPDEVVAASSGTAHRVKDVVDQRVFNLPLNAVGEAQEGDTKFRVEFYFEKDALKLIKYAPIGAMDCAGQEAFLLRHFGPAEAKATSKVLNGKVALSLNTRKRKWALPSGDEMAFNTIEVVRADTADRPVPPVCANLISAKSAA